MDPESRLISRSQIIEANSDFTLENTVAGAMDKLAGVKIQLCENEYISHQVKDA